MASRSTKYTSLFSWCHLPDDSQRAIHNQSTIERFETSPVWVQKIFLTVQEIVRGRSRIPENLFYNSIPIIRTKVCENVNKGKNVSRDMILKSAFITAQVEILTEDCKLFFGVCMIIFNYFHRKLFVIKTSSIIILILKSKNL